MQESFSCVAPPAARSGATLASAFERTGAFRAVTQRGSLLAPDMVVEVSAGELYGDFRNRDQLEAVLSLRLAFFELARQLPPHSLLDKEYSRRIPVEDRTAVVVIAGWNDALGQIVRAVVADLEQQPGSWPGEATSGFQAGTETMNLSPTQTTACEDRSLHAVLHGGSG